jgi:predicted lipoprotein
MRVLAVLLLCWPVLATAQSRFTADEAAVLQQGLTTTADDFILPAYDAQAQAAAGLVAALDGFCGASGDIATVKSTFAETFLAWQRSSIVMMGPIMAAEGPMRVQLWPDPKGFSGRAVRAALGAEDPALLVDGGLEGRSIALTNLTALETLVYDDLTPDSYGCALAAAIAKFQADLAAELAAGWTPGSAFRRDYDSAATGNARFASVDEVIRDILSGGVVYVDRLRKFKLLRGLGEAEGAARPERTEAAQSGLGLQSIEVSFRTLSDLYDVPFGLFDIAPDIGGSMEYYVLGQTAGSIADGLAVQSASLTEIAAEDGPMAAELRTFADLVLYHEDYLKTGFTDAIGLTAGFTAADGD